jgi:hypothetical protein
MSSCGNAGEPRIDTTARRVEDRRRRDEAGIVADCCGGDR